MLRLPLAALLALSLLATNVRAEESARPLGARLTERGRTLVSGRVMGFWSNDTPQVYAGNNTWTVRVDPAVTYFLGNHLGLGAALSFGWGKGGTFPTGAYRAHDFALSGEFVWSAKLADRWRLLLRPAIGYALQWSARTGIEVPLLPTPVIVGTESLVHFVRLSASLPIIYAINENIGVGLAPEYLADIPVGNRHHFDDGGAPPGTFNFRPETAGSLQFGLSVGLYASF